MAPCVQVKQAIAREAAKGHMKWESAVLDALKLTRDDVTSLSEEEAQVHFFCPRPLPLLRTAPALLQPQGWQPV